MTPASEYLAYVAAHPLDLTPYTEEPRESDGDLALMRQRLTVSFKARHEPEGPRLRVRPLVALVRRLEILDAYERGTA